MFKCIQLVSSDNNDMFYYLNILSFLCCWYLVEKNIYIWKRKEIALLLLLSFLNPKISFFIGKGGRSVCAERRVMQEGSREQTWQSVMVECKWIKKAILAWRNYLIAPKEFGNIWFFLRTWLFTDMNFSEPFQTIALGLLISGNENDKS